MNSAISVAVGSAITALPYQIHDFPPEVAGIAAGGVALGAGIIAVWRERRKADDDADHRPEDGRAGEDTLATLFGARRRMFPG